MSIDDFVRYQKSRDFAEDLGILKIVKNLVDFEKSFSIWSFVTYVASNRIYAGYNRESSGMVGIKVPPRKYAWIDRKKFRDRF